MSNVEEIKARIDIVDLVSESVALKRSGKTYTGFCPFHSNTRTPAFVVWPETGTWKCFGQCNDGGDIFKFIMKRENLDFPEALRRLAERAGVQLRTENPQQKAQQEENQRLQVILEEAVTFFHHQLMNTEAGRVALDYLHRRGLSDETIERFGLGFAPNEWDALIANFQGKGRQLDDLVEAGLISERESGGYYDRFRNRVLFPIRDSRGGMAGFGARALAPDDVPKYLNSPQTLLFDKSALLYGLDKARRAIRGQDEAVIVEGYMDVIALHQAGFENVVSPMGTALTEQQLRHVKRLTHRIVLALDADAAGTQATLRGLEVARQTLDREDDPVYNPRGLLRHEARLQADIRVTTLPEDKDPDEVVQANPEAWSRLLIDARPIVEHVMLSLSSGRDLEDPKVKSEIAEQVMPLIGDLPNPIERDTYTQKLAHLLHLDERTLMLPPAPRRTRRAHGVRRQRVRESAAGEPKPNFGENTRAEIEAHILGVLIRNPELIYRINRSLEEEELARITSNDFENTDLQEMFRLAQSSLEQDLIEPSSFAIENIPFPLLDRANEIMQNGIAIDARTQKVFEDIIRTIVRLRRKSLETTIDQLRFLIENEWERNDRSMDEYLAVMKQNTNMLHKLEKTMGQFSERKLSSAR